MVDGIELKSVCEPHDLPSHRSRPGSLFGTISEHWDFLAVLLLSAITFPTTLLSPRNMMNVDPPNIDDSWFVDFSYKAIHGIWLGGRVFFSYGPIVQWLDSAIVRWTGYSLGKVYATWQTVGMWAAFLLTALILKLLLPEQPAWKRFLLIIVMVSFWAAPGWGPPDVRPFAGIFIFAVFLRGWYATSERHTPTGFGILAGALCPVAFLVSADIGVYSIASLFIALAGVAFEKGFRRDFLRDAAISLATAAVSACVVAVVINTVFARPFNFAFWRASLAMVSAYRWSFPFAMDKASKMQFLYTLGVALAVFAIRFLISRTNGGSITERRGFLIAAFIYGLLTMQSGMVRSDMFHVQQGLFAMTLFITVILFGFKSGSDASTVAVVVTLCFCWFLVEPNHTYSPIAITDRLGILDHPYVACSEGWAEFDHICFKPGWVKVFEDSRKYIQQRTSPSDSILVFPWINIFGSVTGRNVAGSLLLSYVVSDGYLSELDVRRLRAEAPPVGLYFSDGYGWPVDGVPNFTRNTSLWLWIQGHYEADQQVAPGILGVRASYSRADRIRTQTEQIQLPLQKYPVTAKVSTLDLGSPVWPEQGADFLRIRFKVHYPIWWKFRKPVRYQLEITLANGSHVITPFVLPPNQSTDVWFYPWDGDLLQYFAEDDTKWHSRSNSPITHLRLLLTPYDWASVVPDGVAVEAADGVRLIMQH